MTKQIETGLAVGRKHFARIQARGSRWLSRHVPVYIRQHLMVPYYFAPEPGTDRLCLWVIQHPIQTGEKVQFVPFATDLHEEKEISPLPDST